ncbi:MAG: GNAT family N-acetyltransferase [Saprospiraceae bacterium]|nr:GNAT family N-acetyltransferase [Saprospiraceae bacterium]
MKIKIAQTEADIALCRSAILALRPHLTDADLVALVKEIQSEGYKLAFVETEEGEAAAICGYRYLQFLFCGKHFYIDDLSTLPQFRGRGYGSVLLDFVIAEAQSLGFNVVTLDSGHHRHDAHRLYLNKGFAISSHHFTKKLNG